MKQRIFLGLTPLFLLLIAMGVYAVSLFAKLGNSVDVILRENFRSVIAGQQMKETAERMDSALFFSLVGEEERARKMYDQNLPEFRESLTVEMHNVTLPGEGELANKVQQLHGHYTERAEVFWQTRDIPARRKMYFDEMLPTFTAVKDTAQEIIKINQDNMVDADRKARALSEKSTRYMIFALLVGIAGAVYFAARLQRSILEPIQALRTVSKELGEGKLDQVVPVMSQDELGQLADAFNKMATKLRAYRQVMGDQILQARQMTEITFSAFPDPIIVVAADGRVNFANPAANTFLFKLGMKDGLPPGVQEEVNRIVKGAPDYLPTSFDRVIVFRIDEQEVFVLPRVIGMRDETGSIFGAAVVLQDVTRLRLLDEVKTNLVSTVSHELKTPLTSVRMGLHLLLEERIGSLNPKQTELLLAAREDSERLLRMINDLLDLAKLESGRTALPSLPMDPRELIDNAQDDLRALVESRGSKLVTKVTPGLPRVSVDARQVAHVFSNFVSNAIKHTKPGEEIVLRAKNQDGRVRFSVVDHGPGIPIQFQGQIFDRFFRLPGSESTGAGLGLAIAREIVLAQGGVIGVQSEPGKGSEFYFDLPAIPTGGIT
ncbi:multi-sensor signal transduction histidine kinase [Chthoniobacter flavus Ellin428]|uniref:histidine kinase n=1 Tax=Chthoniobacter flavus Ellin428 TaxID=497964 RepID=B4CY76_9BACT|nr:ATP-binding protein [Chthoniobacter flavus]EDY21224.1 multi-sensor signal transduction histidine kinase [Chthoniobacter flavus Ellin428]TCO87593.1 signal transduction histidine kinase [Chthoniobacter flavus]